MSYLQQRIKALSEELKSLSVLERRQEARGGLFVMCDLDGFKQAQDKHSDGHVFGDMVLRIFTEFLNNVTRGEEDRVAVRVGGDEFIVWVPSLRAAVALEERIAKWELLGITCSAGYGSTVEKADTRLMERKRRPWYA